MLNEWKSVRALLSQLVRSQALRGAWCGRLRCAQRAALYVLGWCEGGVVSTCRRCAPCDWWHVVRSNMLGGNAWRFIWWAWMCGQGLLARRTGMQAGCILQALCCATQQR
jgi:hypothetical protein